jgi:hypothetical protein
MKPCSSCRLRHSNHLGQWVSLARRYFSPLSSGAAPDTFGPRGEADDDTLHRSRATDPFLRSGNRGILGIRPRCWPRHRRLRFDVDQFVADCRSALAADDGTHKSIREVVARASILKTFGGTDSWGTQRALSITGSDDPEDRVGALHDADAS